MRELRGRLNASVATRLKRQLPVQRVRSLPQGEWMQSTTDQAKETSGKSFFISLYFFPIS